MMGQREWRGLAGARRVVLYVCIRCGRVSGSVTRYLFHGASDRFVALAIKDKFQVIITDHPDFTDDARFQAAVRERWRDGLKLVPDDWPAA
ncbi:hypothetical protein LGM35_05000 [Burkholderia cenocepacia]|uniref:hypothetical protein n=1 Tax=Burkholderia cenocepacia TaxID=95486 RepID=UPI001CF33F67|nr:hypothetical protein [Burkholderia cenocepacia]MCA7921832.1 hypothetical protein [Burkholderia cenocepacia]